MGIRVLSLLLLGVAGCFAIDTWVNSGGQHRYVSMGPSGVWSVGPEGEVFWRRGTASDTIVLGTEWVQVEGPRMKQLDVGNGTVWGISNCGNEVYYLEGISSGNPTGVHWARVAGSLKHISVSPNNHVWGIDTNDNIVYRENGSWTVVPGPNDNSFTMITNGRQGTWGVDTAGNLFHRQGTYGDEGGVGSSWSKLTGNVKWTSCGYVLMVLNNDGKTLRRRTNLRADHPMGTAWSAVSSSRTLDTVEVFKAGTVWGIKDNVAYYGD